MAELLGILGTLGGTLLGWYLSTWNRRRQEKDLEERYFRALYDEIKLNISVAEETEKDILPPPKPYPLTGPPKPDAPLYTQCYWNIRSSGYLVTLDVEVRVKLQKTFDRGPFGEITSSDRG